jgi:drug/metabolite transporter (DMT)-like permease
MVTVFFCYCRSWETPQRNDVRAILPGPESCGVTGHQLNASSREHELHSKQYPVVRRHAAQPRQAFAKGFGCHRPLFCVILQERDCSAIFMRTRVSARVILGASVGIAGIAAIFWSEVSSVENSANTWRGLWMCLIATYFASIGNILSVRNQKQGIPVVQTNAWGMAYGASILVVFALFSGVPFNYDASFSYSVSLIYLSIFGSILAFGSYLTLVGRIGADKAAYSAVLFPVIALGLSTLFEDYQWTLRAIFGFGLVLLGNYIVLTKSRKQLKAQSSD